MWLYPLFATIIVEGVMANGFPVEGECDQYSGSVFTVPDNASDHAWIGAKTSLRKVKGFKPGWVDHRPSNYHHRLKEEGAWLICIGSRSALSRMPRASGVMMT
jgi:hypothetical protein